MLLPPSGSGRLDVDALDVVAITQSIEVFRVPGGALNSIAASGNDDDNVLELGNLDAAFAGLISMDAGEGTDTLRLIGSNQTLDLTSFLEESGPHSPHGVRGLGRPIYIR